MDKFKFNIPTPQRFLLLLFSTLFGYIIAAVVAAIVMGKGLTGARVAIVTIVQDVTVFILPALITATIATRRPADLLAVVPAPRLTGILLAIMSICSVIPVMNVIIEWNAGIDWLHHLGGFSKWMVEMENAANDSISSLVTGGSVLSLIVLILVVGIFAGFAEEIFFRGCLQRLMITSGMNAHAAIWIGAIIFSAFHMQFFGFVPRMLLGAMFGYLAWWQGSVWVAVVAHITNNTLAAITMWVKAGGSGGEVTELETVGTDSPVIAAFSILLTVAVLYLASRNRTR